MITEFVVLVLYTQLHVATPAGATQALHWTDEHVAQGFTWNEAVVAFGVPDHDGQCLVRVDTAFTASEEAVAANALWAIAVPFTAIEPIVQIGSPASARAFSILPGRYQLIFQARPAMPPYAYRLELTFTAHTTPEFAILKQGELESDEVLHR